MRLLPEPPAGDHLTSVARSVRRLGPEHALGAFGVAALLVFATMWVERFVSSAWDAKLLSQKAVVASRLPAGTPPHRVVSGSLLGRLDIPRLGLSASVREGVDASTLDVAVGHVPGSASPGGEGNAALAAHRDAEFRPLRNIRVGDEVRFVGPAGSTRYRVAWVRIVSPTGTEVLAPDVPEPALTLVTCYPFGYVGRAPKRFVVRATKV